MARARHEGNRHGREAGQARQEHCRSGHQDHEELSAEGEVMNTVIRNGALLAIAATAVVATVTAAAPETFSATASVKKGTVIASAPVRVNVTRYATDAEREAAVKAVRTGGTKALKALLASKPDVGYIELADKRTAVKFAGERTSGGGRLITVV